MKRENDFGSFLKQVPEKPVVEEQLKRFRSVGGDDHYYYHRPQNPPATMLKTTGEQENNRNDSSLKNHQSRPLFTVLFIKCSLESCLDFALTVEDINRHLYKVHGIIAGNRCIATERCVRQQVHFRTRSLLQKHLKDEHVSNYFQCYQCYRPSNTIITFRRYNSLERHCHFNHDEGHFVCNLCEEGQRQDPSTGCRLYAFSAKYCGLVVQHWREVHRSRSAPLLPFPVIEEGCGGGGDQGSDSSSNGDNYQHRRPAVKRRLKTEEALLIKERGEVIEKEVMN